MASLSNSPQQSSRMSTITFSATFFERSFMSSLCISCFALCSLVTADADDDASELFSRPLWLFKGDVSFGSDCGSVGILTTTDFPFWFTIWVLLPKKNNKGGKDNFRMNYKTIKRENERERTNIRTFFLFIDSGENSDAFKLFSMFRGNLLWKLLKLRLYDGDVRLFF